MPVKPARLYNNLDINYTVYYNVLEFFRQLLSQHPSVQRVTYGDFMEMDMDVFPQYPLANIQITDAVFGNKTTTYSVKIILADKIHDKENTSSGSLNQETQDFWGSDDNIDIHANTLSVLNDLLSFLRRGVTAFNIQGDVRCIAFKEEYPNSLGGWVADFQLETPNEMNICLFDFNLDENC